MSKSKTKSKKCSKGEIKRVGYVRRVYKRTDGTKVKGSSVAASCVRDMGRVGKASKTLPKLDPSIHLSKYGYTLDRKEESRRSALRKASRAIGDLPTLRRLNLIRNYTATDSKNKDILSKDVQYLSARYEKIKKNSK